MNEHDRRILGPKSKPVSSRDALAEFARSHHFCQACGKDGDATIHHIIGGRGGRSDEACNLLYLCWEPCHMLAEGLDVPHPDWGRWHYATRLLPKLTLGIQLSMKFRADELTPETMDRLEHLHGRALPPMEPIPKLFIQLYRRNRPETS